MLNVVKSVYKCLEVANGNESIRLVVGDNIQFANEAGERKTGVIEDFGRGKDEKTEIIIIPSGENHKETWCVMNIQEDSLRIINDNEEA